MSCRNWKQYSWFDSRSPSHRVPWWVLIWIKRSPLVFIVLSFVCFSIGLVLFTYSSGQHKITSTVTTVFSAFSCFGLAAVSAWFMSERWIFGQHKGGKLLADVLADFKMRIYSTPAMSWWVHTSGAYMADIITWTRKRWRKAMNFCTRTITFTRLQIKLRIRRVNDLESPETGEMKPSEEFLSISERIHVLQPCRASC
jgi:WD repeat-containing protein 26